MALFTVTTGPSANAAQEGVAREESVANVPPALSPATVILRLSIPSSLAWSMGRVPMEHTLYLAYDKTRVGSEVVKVMKGFTLGKL
ncbi:MAG TPA: hypothetical protein VGS79_00625 [Puia sp.]|nr:hypothetical protein [Puia sp.]